MSTTDLLLEDPLRHLERLNYISQEVDADDTKQDVLLFTIPGNPGIISYYQPFVAKLHDLLCKSASSITSRFFAYGYSFANFGTQRHLGGPKQTPYSLQDQIEWTEDHIYDEIGRHLKTEDEKDIAPKVILIGHSVGAYILLEIIRRHTEQARLRGIDFDLIGGVLLFPTITDIAKSPMGIISDVGPNTLWTVRLRWQVANESLAIGTNPAPRFGSRSGCQVLGRPPTRRDTSALDPARWKVSGTRGPGYGSLHQEPDGSTTGHVGFFADRSSFRR